MRVVFYLPEPPAELARLAALDPDRDWRELTTGERAWILQTYLRLSRAGRPVELAAETPPGALVLFHSKHERFVRRSRGAGRAVLAGVRADNRQALAAELEILQNGRWADGRRRFAIVFWPQPGLVPRDPARGDRLERIGYKGFAANLHPELAGPAFAAALAERGIVWDADAIDFTPGAAAGAAAAAAARWADFREVDAVVAVRPRQAKTEFSKPATKLANAWLAGVPALLGPEYAFRELRRSELDYLEVDGAAGALAAIDRLRGEPGLYRAMVENGRRRSAEVDVPALVAAWESLLFDRLPAAARAPAAVRARRLPLALRRAGRLLARWASGRPPR